MMFQASNDYWIIAPEVIAAGIHTSIGFKECNFDKMIKCDIAGISGLRVYFLSCSRKITLAADRKCL